MTVQSRYESLASIKESEIDVVSIAEQGTPLYTALSMPWREAVNGQYTEMGLWEATWSNGHKVYFKELGENIRVFQLNGAIADGVTTTFVFDSTAGLIANAILKFPSTWEQVKVASVTNATTAEVVRWFGTTAAAAIADDATAFFVSTTLPAGQASVDAIAVDAVEVDNEIQKIVTTVKQSDFEDFLRQNPNVQDKVGGYLKSQIIEHGKRIENAMLLSQKKYDSTNKQGTMEWVLELTKRSWNYDDLSGWLTKSNLIAALSKPFRYGDTQTKMALCGKTALDKVALLFEDRLQVGKIENSSLKFSNLALPGWEEVRFIRHPYMNSDTDLAGSILVLDPKQIQVVYAAGSNVEGKSVSGKTRIIPNMATSTYAETTVDIVTYVSLKNANAKAHGLIKLA